MSDAFTEAVVTTAEPAMLAAGLSRQWKLAGWKEGSIMVAWWLLSNKLLWQLDSWQKVGC
jgi:hypothetical protein